MATFSSTSTVLERLGDRYEILRPIGQPFGYQQLLAKDVQKNHAVVIKSLAIEENTPTGDICCFEREIQLLELLNHPTIPRYIDSFSVSAVQQGQPHLGQSHLGQSRPGSRRGLVLVQSHPGGNTLAQQVAAQTTFSEADIKALAKQLLQGLVYLHGKGLVHRDIKPDNIAMAKPSKGIAQRDTSPEGGIGQASWLNLGTVQYVQAQRNDALVGTYGYMPPEQVGGQATFASDLYSLGATLIYLVSGHHLGDLPHKPNSPELKNGLKTKFACSPARLSPCFQQWLNWLIEPYVGDRPKSAKQALAALNQLPFSMLKRQLRRPSAMHMLPIPIPNGHREQYQPFFTQIKSVKKLRSLELIVPPIGIKIAQVKRALPPLIMGAALLSVALYLFSLLHFSPAMLNSPQGLFSGIASLAAASLGTMGCLYSVRFFKSGLRLLNTFLLRQVHIQLEADVLLIAYKYWLRSPIYVVNAKRADIYSISTLPNHGRDDGALRILTHRNRTRTPHDCYKLTIADGALSHRDIRWLTSLLNNWRAGSCPTH
jgi:serine/threonine protein kinase